MASNKILSKKLKDSLVWPFFFVVFLWIVHLLQISVEGRLIEFGLKPREISGLRGIIFSPLLHADFSHLASNSLPFFVLGAMILFFYRKVAIQSFLLIYLFSGIGVWFFARSSFHIGASGLVYGMVAFVFWTGIFRRNIKSIALALVVLFYYGSLFLGIVPVESGISWEGHLIGAIVGIAVAYLFKNSKEKDEQRKVPSWENEIVEEKKFLPSDTFERTKKDRDQRDNGPIWFSNTSWRQ